MHGKRARGAIAAGFFLFGANAADAAVDKRAEATNLVADAAETTRYFTSDPAFEPLWRLAGTAKAMVIIPEKIRAGFVFGGSAGDAAMLARNKDGTWSQPTFMTVGSFSFGFQAGAEASEIILLVMTQRGMEHLLSTSVKLGADVSVAAGPVGGGAKAATTDILAFSRSRGLYGGASVEGAVLKTRANWNNAYYGATLAPAEIIYRQEGFNPASAVLQEAVWSLANKDASGGAATAPTVLGPSAPSPTGYGAPIETNPIDPVAPGAVEGGPGQSARSFEDDELFGGPQEDPQ